MEIQTATSSFEHWLGNQVHLNSGDLRHKHVAMSQDPFSFLRATYYRWAQQFDDLPQTLSKAPLVLAVGDLHLENYGTWRDSLGRLAWGVNDFDEAFELPYTNDLIRLATSALLVIDAKHIRINGKTACHAILEGYREGIAVKGRPFIIGDEHRWFKPILQGPGRDPGKFWDKLRGLPSEKSRIPQSAKMAINAFMPSGSHSMNIRHRVAGLGSLGKPRFTAIAEWEGGPVAREAKALSQSAVAWAHGLHCAPYYRKILAGAIRASDPFLGVKGAWVIRRLAPDCRRIELASLVDVNDEEWLLHAMGFELANVHLGNPECRGSIRRHLSHQVKGWLRAAATHMRDAVITDFKSWCGYG